MRLLIGSTAAAALAVAIAAPAATPAKKVLKGTVGPGFVITLKNAAGQPVETLKAGEYSLVVQDKSAIHMFHLTGPGINKAVTGIGFRGTRTLPAKLKVGRYIYQCDPHSLDMKASFKVTA